MQLPVIKGEVSLGSLLNLLALIGILVTAVGSYYAVKTEASQANEGLRIVIKKMEQETAIRQAAVTNLRERYDNMTRTFTDLQLKFIERLGKIEGEQKAQGLVIERIEKSLEVLSKKMDQSAPSR